MNSSVFTKYSEEAKKLSRTVEKELKRYAIMKEIVAAYMQAGDMPVRRLSHAVARRSTPEDITGEVAVRNIEPPEHILYMQEWVDVIEKARDEMRYYAPELEEILAAYYGLDSGPRRCHRSAMLLRMEVMEEKNISQTTFYNKKSACIEWVKALALHKGLLHTDRE